MLISKKVAKTFPEVHRTSYPTWRPKWQLEIKSHLFKLMLSYGFLHDFWFSEYKTRISSITESLHDEMSNMTTKMAAIKLNFLSCTTSD